MNCFKCKATNRALTLKSILSFLKKKNIAKLREMRNLRDRGKIKSPFVKI